MALADWIVSAVIVLIIGAVIGYIINAKRKGVKCIGCPDSKNCSAYKNGCCCGREKQILFTTSDGLFRQALCYGYDLTYI